MLLNEAISFKRNKLRTKGLLSAKLLMLIGIGAFSVGVVTKGIERLDMIEELGTFPLIAVGLSPIAFLIKISSATDYREAFHIFRVAKKLEKAVLERDIILEQLDASPNKEAFIARNARKIERLTKKQQANAKILEDVLDTRDAQAFIRDSLPGYMVKTIYDAIEAGKAGTLNNLANQRRMNESFFSFSAFTSPKTILAKIVAWSFAGAMMGTVMSRSSSLDFHPIAIAHVGLISLVSAHVAIHRVASVQYNEMQRSVRELERVVEERDYLFKEFMGIGDEEDQKEWLIKNARKVSELTRKQSKHAHRLSKVIGDSKSLNYLDNLPTRKTKPLFDAIEAAKKGTLSQVLADRRMNESLIEESYINAIADRKVKVSNIDKWGKGGNDMLFITGAPGDGKSVLSRELAQRTGAVRINGDRVIREAADEFDPNGEYEDRDKAWKETILSIIRRYSGGRLSILEGVLVANFAADILNSDSPVITFDASFIVSIARAAKRDKGAILGSWHGYMMTGLTAKSSIKRWTKKNSTRFEPMTVAELLEKING